MQRIGRNIARWLTLMAAALLVACGGGGGGAGSAPTYTVGGTVSGLVGAGLVLQVNGSGNLAIPANGTYAFPGVVTGTAYSVTVLTQPTAPAQSCAVTNGSGSVAGADVSNITVTCTTLPTFSVGGAVIGLAGTGLSIRNNGTNTLAIAATGTFAFTTELLNSATYSVTVASQPTNPAQSCTVANGTDTIASLDVTDVIITCVTLPTFPVGGSVTGLLGTGLVLQNNAGDNLSIAADGTFTFATPVVSSTTFNVTVLTQPGLPIQACTVTGGAGTATAVVSSVGVNCQLPAPKFAFVANRFGTTVTPLRVEPSGSLTVIVSAPAVTVSAGASAQIDLAPHPSGKFLYAVSNDASGTVTVASINPTTGALTKVGFIRAGARPQSITVDPTGKFAYVANFSGNDVAVFQIDQNNGGLTRIGAIAAGTNPLSVRVDPTGKYAYVASGITGAASQITQFNISSTSGSLTFAATTVVGTTPYAIATDPLGRYAYSALITANTVSAYSINSGSGALTEIDQNGGAAGTTVPSGISPSALAIDPLGKFVYVVNNDPTLGNSVSAYSINPATGALVSLGPVSPAGTSPVSAVVDPSGRFLYVVNAGSTSGSVSAYTINASTGALSPAGLLTIGTDAWSIAVTR